MQSVSNYIYIYTDGSCLNNGSKTARGGCGLRLFTDIKEIKKKEFSFNCKNIIDSVPTNQKTELLAIIAALKLIEKIFNKYSQYNILHFKLIIFTDSKYSIDCITKWIKNWEQNDWKTAKKKPVKNQVLLKVINRLIGNIENDITFKHVRAHQQKTSTQEWLGNDSADKLAKAGAKNNV